MVNDMDIKHFYIEKGRGFPLILLHGNGENSFYFKHQIDEFSRYYHVYAIDTRGHGKTARGTAPFKIQQFADDLYYFMQDKNISKAHILGFSDGGNIAIYFALKYPDKLSELILNGANLFPEGMKDSVLLEIQEEYKSTKQNSPQAEMLELMLNEPDISPEELKNISCRVLVIAGKDDMIKEEHTRLIAESIENSRLEIIEGNHFIAYRQYREFNRIVLDFLK